MSVSVRVVLVALAALMLLPGAAAFADALYSGTADARLLLVSRANGKDGVPSDAATAGPLSANGRYAGFYDSDGLHIRDLRTDRNRHLGDVGSGAVLSADARTLAYNSDGRVFARDLRTGARALVSRPLIPLEGSEAFGSSGWPSISGSGGLVAFESSRRGLVDEDDDRRADRGYSPYQVYLRDLRTRTTTLISRASGADGDIGDGESSDPSISANGRYVAFTSRAGNLMPGAPRREEEVYVRDLLTDRTRLVSAWESRPGPHRSGAQRPAISANGRYVVFSFGRFGGPSSVIVRDLRSGKTVNVSLLTRTPLEVGSGPPSISADGRFVAFRAHQKSTDGQRLYLVDLRTRRTHLVAPVGTDEGGSISFSADGRFLLFDDYVGMDPKADHPTFAHGKVYRYSNPFAD